MAAGFALQCDNILAYSIASTHNGYKEGWDTSALRPVLASLLAATEPDVRRVAKTVARDYGNDDGSAYGERYVADAMFVPTRNIRMYRYYADIDADGSPLAKPEATGIEVPGAPIIRGSWWLASRLNNSGWYYAAVNAGSPSASKTSTRSMTTKMGIVPCFCV